MTVPDKCHLSSTTLQCWEILLPKTGGWRTWTPKISYLEDHSFPCVQLYPASYKLQRDKEPVQEKTVSTWVSSPRAADSLSHQRQLSQFTARAEHFQRGKQNYQFNKLHRKHLHFQWRKIEWLAWTASVLVFKNYTFPNVSIPQAGTPSPEGKL